MASLATEKLEGNSLTQYERSVSNLLGTSGADTQAKGQADINPALDYWKGILGKKSELAAAVQPEISASNDQFTAQRRTIDQYTPMGGGRSANLQNLGAKQASTNAGIIAKTRAGAAPALAETGLQEQSLGVQQLQTAIQAILSKMGLDIQGGTSNTFSSIMQGIGAII